MLNIPKILVRSHNEIFNTQMIYFLEGQHLGANITDSIPEGEKPDIIITDSEEFIDINSENLLFLEKDVDYDYDALNMPHTTLYKKGEFDKFKFTDSLKKSVEKITLAAEESGFEREYVKENKLLKQAQEERNSDIANIKDFQSFLYTSSSTPMFHFKSFSIYRPERTSGVSGDVLFFKETPGRFYLMMTDVTNHGLLAGYYGISIYTCSESFTESAPPKDQNVTEWARWLIRMSSLAKPKAKSKYAELLSATVTLIVVDMEKCIAEALLFGSGQEPPILISNGEAKLFPNYDNAIAPPLHPTVSPAITLPTPAKTPFNVGDMLMVYSDGLTELFAGETKFSKTYSNSRLLSKANAVISTGQVGVKKMALSILDDANSFTGNYSKKIQTKTDDLTLGCFKWEQ